MESSSPAAAFTTVAETIFAGTEDEEPAAKHSLIWRNSLWLFPLQPPPLIQNRAKVISLPTRNPDRSRATHVTSANLVDSDELREHKRSIMERTSGL